MKLLLFTTFVTLICYVNAGKRARLLAAVAAMNGGLANGANPALMAGGLNPPLAAGAGAGFIGQPQFPQYVPVPVPALTLQAPVPNVYPVPAVNAYQLPYMGVPQMAQMNVPQQPMMGMAGGAVPQQPPVQPDPLRRFRRQILKQANNLKSTVDTQIPPPTDTTTKTLCDEDEHHEEN